MGGDFAPQAVVLGAIQAARQLAEGSRIVLFGDKARIEEILSTALQVPAAPEQ